MFLLKRFKSAIKFLEINNIKTYNYSQACLQNKPTRKIVSDFKFKLSNETKCESSELDSKGNIVIQNIKNPTILKMQFFYNQKINQTDSQSERMKAFKQKKKEERAKYQK